MDLLCGANNQRNTIGKVQKYVHFWRRKNWFVLLPATDTFPKHDKFSCVDHPEKYG